MKCDNCGKFASRLYPVWCSPPSGGIDREVCDRCAESDARCWCGGDVGPRVPGDENGLGCLEDIRHAWQAPPASRTRNGLHNLLICCGPIPPGGTPGCCRSTPPASSTSEADHA